MAMPSSSPWASSSSAPPSASTTKRLIHELNEYKKYPNEALIRLEPLSDDNLLVWEAVLKGIPGSPYEDGLWHLTLTIPPSYPHHPPSITFDTRIAHPNISFTTGEICLTLLSSEHWTPAYTLSSTMSAIHQLLTDPRPESPLNVDVAALLRDGDTVGWESLVRFWTAEERWRGDGR